MDYIMFEPESLDSGLILTLCGDTKNNKKELFQTNMSNIGILKILGHKI